MMLFKHGRRERERGRDLCKGREAVGSVRYIVKGRTEHGVKIKKVIP